MNETKWYDEEDGPEVVDLDDDDLLDEWFAEDDSADRVVGLWDSYGFSGPTSVGSRTLRETELRVVRATRLVQGIVDTFTTAGRSYKVGFSSAVRTAGTDFDSKRIIVSSAPLYDKDLSDSEAVSVLTGMGVHEAYHDRYGRRTAAAVRKEWPIDRRAAHLGNVLDDVRIEAQGSREYPGFAGVFRPTLDYIARKNLPDGQESYEATKLGALDVPTAALRYSSWVDWTGREEDRDWWTAWGARWSGKSKSADHVAAIREGLAHLDEQKQKQEEEKTEQGEEKSETEQGEETSGTQGGGQETSSSGTSQDEDEDPILPTCVEQMDYHGDERAQRLIEQTEHLDITDDGSVGEVYWTPRGLARLGDADQDAVAAATVRRAFGRSRGGWYGIARRQRSGRLDNRSLPRVAFGDASLFSRRKAPSVAKHRVWLLVDCSTSMDGHPIASATSVAMAIASATQFLPNVELEVFGWTTAMKQRNFAGFGVVRVWSSGDPIRNISYLPGIRRGGTPDAAVLRWAGKAIKRFLRAEERPLIILASDGEGTLSVRGEGSIVSDIRATGVDVVSLAIGDINEQKQERIYGRGNYVPWAGSIRATARPIGEMLGRIAAGGTR